MARVGLWEHLPATDVPSMSEAARLCDSCSAIYLYQEVAPIRCSAQRASRWPFLHHVCETHRTL